MAPSVPMLTTLTALLVSCSLSFCMTLPPSNRLKLKHQVFAQIAGTLAASGGIEDATATGKPRSLRHAPPSLFAYDVDCRGSCYPLAGEAELKLLDDIGTSFATSRSTALLARVTDGKVSQSNWRRRLSRSLEEGIFLVDEDALFFTYEKGGRACAQQLFLG